MKKLFLLTTLLCSLFSLNAYSYDDDDDHGRRRCYNAERIMRAAHSFERAANHFAELLTNRGGPWSHISGDAINLAEAANHLHEMSETGRSCRHIRRDFRSRLDRAYRHLRRQLRGAHRDHHSRHVMRDFRRLQWSFYSLRRTIYGWRYGGGHGGGYGGGYGGGHGNNYGNDY